jgi:phospholipid/cholesterol/gamma-HCH transport system substrate-binding protein
MADQAKNILIGLFVVAAGAVIIFILLFLHPTAGDEAKILRVRFANIDKISVGTRATFAGKPIGEVVSIHEIPEAIDHRIDRHGHVYVYEVILRVDSTVNVYDSDEITAKTSGLFGEKSVAIIPIAPKPGKPLKLMNDQIIYADESGSVEEALKELRTVGQKLDIVLDGLVDALEDVRKQKIVEKIGDITGNVRDITHALNVPEKWSGILDNAHTLTNRALQSWNTVDVALNNTKQLTEDGKTLIANINQGEGSLGKILVRDDLYLQVKAIMSKMNTVADDVNHYGILFHLDKGWQRLRARRMNLLFTLSTPQEFRNYFNDEVDMISTSLSRVSMILDQTACYCPPYELIQDNEFGKVFSELLRRVAELEESLLMYNQQMIDTQNKETELTDCY